MAVDTEFGEKVEKLRQAGVEIDRPVRRFNGWNFGDRAMVLRDDDENGLCAGDKGILAPEEVGRPQWNNVRTRLFILLDGHKSALAIEPHNVKVFNG